MKSIWFDLDSCFSGFELTWLWQIKINLVSVHSFKTLDFSYDDSVKVLQNLIPVWNCLFCLQLAHIKNPTGKTRCMTIPHAPAHRLGKKQESLVLFTEKPQKLLENWLRWPCFSVWPGLKAKMKSMLSISQIPQNWVYVRNSTSVTLQI